jgi:hypothetical protein
MTISMNLSPTIGRDGRSIISLESAPTDADGRIGDFAIVYDDGEAAEIYGPKTEDGWGDPSPMKGQAVLWSGSSAPASDFGRNGDFAIRVSSGVVTFYGPKAADVWPAGYTLNGPSILGLSVPPTGSDGVNGDYAIVYIDDDVVDIYGPKSAGSWPSGRHLRGSKILEVNEEPDDEDDGQNGDYAVVYNDDDEAITFYGPKVDDEWPEGRDLRGPAAGLVKIGRTVTSSGDIVASDLGTLIIVDSSSSVTLSLPDDLEHGFWCMVIRADTGAVIFAPKGGSSAVIRHPYNHDRIGVQYGSVTLMLALSATEWSILGETAAA